MHQTMPIDPALREVMQQHITNGQHEMASAEAAFHARYPAYASTAKLDDLRRTEYARLDADGHIYLDYTGGGLYAASQVQRHMQLLLSGVYGNPHSVNPTSSAATELSDGAREAVYRFFNADPAEYVVIFTSNASGALKLVGESYPFEQNGQYLLTFDNHNSVNGIREYAKAKGAPVTYSPVLPPDLRIDADALHANLDQAIPGGHNLFSYPAQSNFSGVKHDLSWVETARAKGWHVLLDGAAYTPTNRLDLSVTQPDFLSLSFYKIFGYPTGVGALVARRDALHVLHRPWFAGGTITVASVQANAFYYNEGEAAYEDGTINYLNLPAVKIGLEHLESIGMALISERVRCLTGYLLDELSRLTHSNGKPLARIYGPLTTEQRGGTIALNLYDPDGTIFDFHLVEALATEARISLRTGCFCNPGAGETALNIAAQAMQECFANPERMTFAQFAAAMSLDYGAEAVGAVRISVGLASTFADVYHLTRFLRTFVDQKSSGLHFES